MPFLWESDRVRVGSMAQAVVCIVMGSANDWPIMQGAAEMLARFHIPYEVTVSSAHRAPQRTAVLAHEAAQRGVQVHKAGARGAAGGGRVAVDAEAQATAALPEAEPEVGRGGVVVYTRDTVGDLTGAVRRKGVIAESEPGAGQPYAMQRPVVIGGVRPR